MLIEFWAVIQAGFFTFEQIYSEMTHPLIERNPEIMLGKPVIKGTRLTVELLMRKLSDGFTVGDILEMYPHLKLVQLQAAFAFAADKIANEIILEPA